MPNAKETVQYSPEIMDRICGEIIEGGASREILKESWAPSSWTFYNWLRRYPNAARMYAIAKELQADLLVDKVIEMADAGCSEKEITAVMGRVGMLALRGYAARPKLRLERPRRVKKVKPAAPAKPDRTTATTLESFAHDRLDVHDLVRRGAFNDYSVCFRGGLRWPRIATMQVFRYAILIHLTDRAEPQRINVSWTAMPTGGGRPWLHCPHCQRRAMKLYRGLVGYLCFTCIGRPAYACQLIHHHYRPRYAASKLRLGLGGDARLDRPFPDKPKGMSRKVYLRLRRKGLELESRLSEKMKRRMPDYSTLSIYLN